MIDIHSHILFGVDDGPSDKEAAKRLLLAMYQQGIRTIVATPHQRKGMFEATKDKIQARYLETVQLAQEIAPDLTLLLGSEIYVTQGTVAKIEQDMYLPLADTKILLVEFPYEVEYRELYKQLKAIIWAGYRVVIAHIERYDAFENHADRVEELLNLGCYMQVNAASLLPIKLFDKQKQRKKRARYFLAKHLVQFIASDAHNTENRACYMQEAYAFLVKEYGQKVADDLCSRNQEKLLKLN